MGKFKHKIEDGVVIGEYTHSDGVTYKILLDEEDRYILSLTSWYVDTYKKALGTGRTSYCIGRRNNRIINEGGYEWLGVHLKMHRLILSRVLGRPLQKNEHVDHINQNGLDNRRQNLRIATASQNHANKPKARGDFSSPYKGVYIRKERLHLGWYACIGSNKSKTPRIYLGRYETEEEAARAYDRKAIEIYGEFAYTNFPIEEYK